MSTEGTQDRFAELLIHSPISAVFCATDSTGRATTYCSESPCSSSQSPAASSHTPHSHQGSSLDSPIYLPQCSSPSSSEASSLSYWLPNESLDWREWIDEIIDEVRNEINSEIMFNQLAQPTQTKSSSSRKRKAQTSSPASVDSGVSSAHSPSSQSSVPSKRAKKYSLATLSHEQIAERKKEQNRVAAQRYRSRKTQTLEQGREEISYLEKRNADLKMEMYALEQEIRQVKQQLVGEQQNS